MKVSKKGCISMLRNEAVVLKTYTDSVGVLTIGAGHTAEAGPPKPKPGMKISLDKALKIFQRDIAKYEKAVNDAVEVDLLQHEFDALVDWCYNVGPGNMRRSTLLRHLNAGDKARASREFKKWNKGRVRGKLTALPGLTKRRERNRATFATGDYGNVSTVSVYDTYPGRPRAVAASELDFT